MDAAYSAGPAPSGAAISLTALMSFDSDAMRTGIQNGSFESIQVGAGRFEGQIAHTVTRDVCVDWGAYRLAVLSRGTLGPASLTFAVPIAGRGSGLVLGQTVCAGDLIVLPEGGELQVRLAPETQWLVAQIPRRILEGVGFDLRGLSAGAGWFMPRSRGTSILDAIFALAPGLSPLGIGDSESTIDIDLLHADLLSRLLTELDQRMLDLGHRRPIRLDSREAWRTVSRAEEFLRACGDLQVRIDELCCAVSASISKLDRAFMQVYGMGPQRYLLLRRLCKVHHELVHGSENQGRNVTAAATRWGFAHLGRFAVTYRALFGESPSETARTFRRHRL